MNGPSLHRSRATTPLRMPAASLKLSALSPCTTPQTSPARCFLGFSCLSKHAAKLLVGQPVHVELPNPATQVGTGTIRSSLVPKHRRLRWPSSFHG